MEIDKSWTSHADRLDECGQSLIQLCHDLVRERLRRLPDVPAARIPHFQRLIALDSEVTRLASVADAVTRTQDYQLRARKWAEDELGHLVMTFSKDFTASSASPVCVWQTPMEYCALPASIASGK